MKKTVGIIILIVWFILSAVKGLDSLGRATSSTDYHIFSSNGLTPLFFFFVVGVFLLDAGTGTVNYLFRPRPTGFYVALSAVALSLIQSIVSVNLALSDLPGVRDAYVASREARGLSSRRALDMMFTPQAMYLGLGVVVLLNAVVLFLIIRNRRYFLRHEIKSES